MTHDQPCSESIDCDNKVMLQPIPRKRLVDHPMIGWLLENIGIWWVALSARALGNWVKEPSFEHRSFKSCFLHYLLTHFAVSEGVQAVQWCLVNKVYAHVPYFTKAGQKQSEQSLRKTFWEWLNLNARIELAVACLFAGFLSHASRRAHARFNYSDQPLRLRPFLARLVMLKAISDTVFYIVHRALHSRAFYFLHKRHHEHTATALSTNVHFSVPDLSLEGFAPFFVSLLCLRPPLAKLEYVALLTHYLWFEVASHAGKPVRIVSLLPPLAPLYRCILGDIDKDIPKHHDEHHALRNCNYCLNPWLDHFLGTTANRMGVSAAAATDSFWQKTSNKLGVKPSM